MNEYFTDNSTEREILSNIRQDLKDSLAQKYFIKSDGFVDEFLKLQGIHETNLESLQVMNKFIGHNVNEVTIDANSNIFEKNVAGISRETAQPREKLVGYAYLYWELKKLYGKDVAKTCMKEIYDYSIGLNDSTAILKPYCYSIDASRLITEGRPWGQLPSAPCKNIRSYVSCLCEVVHQLSNHVAGAIATSSFFLDLAHLLLYKHKLDIRELKTNKYMRKEIENTIQQFIHSINMLSRNSQQSPFSNISINDRTKLKKIVTDMGHLFPFDQLPISEPSGMFSEEEKKEFYINYIIDYIMEIQDLFLAFFDKGASTLNGAPFRFPVVSLNLGKKRVGEYGKYQIMDRAFLKKVCKLDIYRYNIFSSEGDKFASCCFWGGQKIHVLDGNEEKFIEIKDAVKIPGVKVKFEGQYYASSPIIIDNYGDYLYKITLANGVVLNVTHDHLHPVYVTKKHTIDVRSEHLMVGNELFVKGERVKITNIRLFPFNGPVYCFKVENNREYFEIEDGILTHNCRLINNAELMDEYASQSNSFGAGGSISIGAHRCVPIDYPRIAIEAETEEHFFDILDFRLDISAKILKAHKSLIKKLEQAGLQPFITNGYLRLDRMFSIFGIVGIYECAEIFKKKFGNGRDCEGIILQFVNSKVKELSKKYDIAGNIEQIPAESFAVRFAKADRLIFGDNCLPYPMLSNQAVPLWADVNIYERLEEDGKYNQLFSGGGIVHATIGERVTGKQAENLICFAVEKGCEHFALNAFWSECIDGHMEFGKHVKCPKCLKEIKDTYTRVSGYFVPVRAMNVVRQEWEIPRRKVCNP